LKKQVISCKIYHGPQLIYLADLAINGWRYLFESPTEATQSLPQRQVLRCSVVVGLTVTE